MTTTDRGTKIRQLYLHDNLLEWLDAQKKRAWYPFGKRETISDVIKRILKEKKEGRTCCAHRHTCPNNPERS